MGQQLKRSGWRSNAWPAFNDNLKVSTQNPEKEAFGPKPGRMHWTSTTKQFQLKTVPPEDFSKQKQTQKQNQHQWQEDQAVNGVTCMQNVFPKHWVLGGKIKTTNGCGWGWGCGSARMAGQWLAHAKHLKHAQEFSFIYILCFITNRSNTTTSSSRNRSASASSSR